MKKTIFLAALICCSILFNSCTKEGPVGPAGPAGTNGSANVSSTDITISPSQWVWNASGGYLSAQVSCQSITSSVINGGAVMAYTSDAGDYVAMPFTITGVSFAYDFVLGQVEFLISLPDASNPGTPTSAQTYKVVTIPPAQRLAHPGIEHLGYGALKETLSIK